MWPWRRDSTSAWAPRRPGGGQQCQKPAAAAPAVRQHPAPDRQQRGAEQLSEPAGETPTQSPAHLTDHFWQLPCLLQTGREAETRPAAVQHALRHRHGQSVHLSQQQDFQQQAGEGEVVRGAEAAHVPDGYVAV